MEEFSVKISGMLLFLCKKVFRSITGEAQFFSQFPDGGVVKAFTGIQMPGGGGVPAQRIGILVGASLLQQQLDSAVFPPGKKDMGSTVQVAVLVYQASRLGLSGACSVLV